MTPMISVSANAEQARETNRTSHCCKPAQSSFSKASHFGLALVPMVLGIAYAMLFRDTQDPLIYRLALYSLFLLGIGSAIFVLSGIGRIEKMEEKDESDARLI